MNIAISGSSGFIGSNLKTYLEKFSYVNLILINREKSFKLDVYNEYTFEDFFSKKINIKIDLFIHLASPNFDKEREMILKTGIFDLTKNIVDTLPAYNCNKFIYFSSCKVYGESSISKNIYKENSILNPVSDYAKAKKLAEEEIIRLSKKNKISYIIYRLPFVYGKGMKSNLGSLIKLIDKSIPFFIFSEKIYLKKSFLSICNINEVIAHNIKNIESINNEIMNLTDDRPISLSNFLEHYKKIKNSKSFLLVVPAFCFKIIAFLPFIGSALIKIYGNFQIDNKKLKEILHLKSTEDCINELVESDNIN